jgi:hypothetical protein
MVQNAMSAAYEIRIKGQLDPKLSAWFDDFAISHTPDGDTLLTGSVIDQAALHGVLVRCRDLGVTLISINPVSTASDQERGTMDRKNWVHVEASHIVDARPEEVYAVISDYRVGHPAILPRQYFTGLEVEKGGQGAGTIVRGSLKVFGQEYGFHQLVSEPEPGRLIEEIDIETGQYTSFTFEPLHGGKQTRVTIVSDFPPRKGLVGFMEKFTMPSIVRKIYNAELRQLADYLRAKAAAKTAPNLA